jgi:hypothetical protein
MHPLQTYLADPPTFPAAPLRPDVSSKHADRAFGGYAPSGLGRSAGRLVCRALNLNRKKARVPPAICEIQIDGTVSGPDSHEQRILRG